MMIRFDLLGVQLALFCGLALSCQACFGQGPAVDSGESSAQRAFQKGSYPWYDADTEMLNLEPELIRGGAAETADRNTIPAVAPAVQGGNMGGASNWWLVVLIVLLVLLLAVVVAAVVWLLMRVAPPAGFSQYQNDSDQERAFGSDRMERLPFDVYNPTGDFLAAAESAYRAGDFRNAVTYLFSHVLLTLDRHKRVRLRRGKTNRQYLNEMQSTGAGSLSGYYERLMVSFESAFFGNYELKTQQFEESWNALTDFQDRLDRLGEVPRE